MEVMQGPLFGHAPSNVPVWRRVLEFSAATLEYSRVLLKVVQVQGNARPD
jgi:hypothetical protein